MEQMEYVGRGDFGRPFTLAEHDQARQKAAEAAVVLRRGLRERALTYDEMKSGLSMSGLSTATHRRRAVGLPRNDAHDARAAGALRIGANQIRGGTPRLWHQQMDDQWFAHRPLLCVLSSSTALSQHAGGADQDDHANSPDWRPDALALASPLRA